MLIRFFNPNDLIGCGGNISQSDSFRYAEGICGGGMQRGYVERACGGVHRGDMQRGYGEGVHGGVHAEGVCRGGAWRGAQRWLPLATINLVGDNREFEV